jgi:hypothetical protein
MADSNGNPAYSVVQGAQITFSVRGDEQMPTYMELSSPETGQYCEYGGVPTQYGTSSDNLKLCPQNPSLSDIPCVLSYSGESGAPSAGDAPQLTISTQNLPSNTYTVCGYEGNPKSAGTDPLPVFFASNSFYIACPPTGCGTQILPTNPNAIVTGPIQAAACSAYLEANQLLLVLALTLVLLGAALYAFSNTLPGSSRGVLQGYAMGLVFAGVASLLISVVSVYALTQIANVQVSQILLANGCPP